MLEVFLLKRPHRQWLREVEQCRKWRNGGSAVMVWVATATKTNSIVGGGEVSEDG